MSQYAPGISNQSRNYATDDSTTNWPIDSRETCLFCLTLISRRSISIVINENFIFMFCLVMIYCLQLIVNSGRHGFVVKMIDLPS